MAQPLYASHTDSLLYLDLSNPLLVACMTGNAPIVDRLFTHRRADTLKCYNIAAYYGQIEVIKLLLKKGASTDTGRDYWGPLEWAALGNRLEIASILLKQQWVSKESRADAVFLAADKGHTEIVKLCLEAGADAHDYEEEALYVAARNGHIETVRLLVDERECRLTGENLLYVPEGECKEYILAAAGRYTKSAAKR